MLVSASWLASRCTTSAGRYRGGWRRRRPQRRTRKPSATSARLSDGTVQPTFFEFSRKWQLGPRNHKVWFTISEVETVEMSNPVQFKKGLEIQAMAGAMVGVMALGTAQYSPRTRARANQTALTRCAKSSTFGRVICDSRCQSKGGGERSRRG